MLIISQLSDPIFNIILIVILFEECAKLHSYATATAKKRVILEEKGNFIGVL